MTEFDPVTSNLLFNAKFPASFEGVFFKSSEKILLGRMLIAQGKGPHPTIVLLHGFPGHELNLDLAHIFRRDGWNVLIFHYRGSWGSQGNYSFTHLVADTRSALTFLRTQETMKRYRVDPHRLVLIGFSMGGFASLMTAAQDTSIQAVASIAGVNFHAWAEQFQTTEFLDSLKLFYTENLPVLHGTTSEKLIDESFRHKKEWNLISQAQSLANRHILLLGGRKDTIVPVNFHQIPLVQALQSNNASNLVHEILDTDHAFSNVRVQLAQIILSWLQALNF